MQAFFSHKDYLEIIKKFQPILCDFKEVQNRENFAVLRHDVEFSMSRALQVAELDHSLGVRSSFLFQVKSEAYNIFSNESLKIIQKTIDLGHYVGLHFYVSHLKENDWDDLKLELSNQRKIFELITNNAVDRFSFHRPPQWVLERRLNVICGMINMYGPSYFEYTLEPKNIKYLADSKHIFSYGHPLENMNFEKYQILLHPDEWTKTGFNEGDNFNSLIDETKKNFQLTLNSETKNYAKYFMV